MAPAGKLFGVPVEDSDATLMVVAGMAAVILCLLVTHLRIMLPSVPPPSFVHWDSTAHTPGSSQRQQTQQQAQRQQQPWGPLEQPLVIAHRGFSGRYPEHTREAYEAAIQAGADVIECDVVLTLDLVPLCRHEPELSGSTDALAKFGHLRRSYVIDGQEVTGVFAADLSLEQVRQLRAVQPWPFRDQQYKLPLITLHEYLDIALSASSSLALVHAAGRTHSASQQQQQQQQRLPGSDQQPGQQLQRQGPRRARVVAVYPETKNPSWHNSLPHVRAANTSIEAIVMAALEAKGYAGLINSERWRAQPAFIQSFETGSLRALSQRTCLPLIQLVGASMSEVLPEGRTTEQVLSAESLRELLALGVAGVGPGKQLLVQWEAARGRYTSTGVVERLHQAGLQVHPYTLRDEARFVLPQLHGNATEEHELLLQRLSVDGAFTDWPTTTLGVLERTRQAGFRWNMDVSNRPSSRPEPRCRQGMGERQRSGPGAGSLRPRAVRVL